MSEPAIKPVPTLALIEVWRGGQLVATQRVLAWPVTIGRALDNDLVINDGYVAPHHLTIDWQGEQAIVASLDTANGVRHRSVAHGARARFEWHVSPDDLPERGALTLAGQGEHWQLRLLTAQAASAAERSLMPVAADSVSDNRLTPPRAAYWLSTAGAVLGVFALYGLTAWLSADRPDSWLRNTLSAWLMVGVALSAWCLLWALVSKIFVGRVVFWPHVRIACMGTLAGAAIPFALSAIAFSLSLDALVRYDLITTIAVSCVFIWAHLEQATSVGRRKLAFAVAALAVVGLSIKYVADWQLSRHFANRLYMSQLFPPAMRLAPAVPLSEFTQSANALRERLAKRLADKSEEVDGEVNDLD